MLDVLTTATQDELFARPAPEKRPAKHPARDIRSLMDRRPISPAQVAQFEERIIWSADPEQYARRCWAQITRMVGDQS